MVGGSEKVKRRVSIISPPPPVNERKKSLFYRAWIVRSAIVATIIVFKYHSRQLQNKLSFLEWIYVPTCPPIWAYIPIYTEQIRRNRGYRVDVKAYMSPYICLYITLYSIGTYHTITLKHIKRAFEKRPRKHTAVWDPRNYVIHIICFPW